MTIYSYEQMQAREEVKDSGGQEDKLVKWFVARGSAKRSCRGHDTRKVNYTCYFFLFDPHSLSASSAPSTSSTSSTSSASSPSASASCEVVEEAGSGCT